PMENSRQIILGEILSASFTDPFQQLDFNNTVNYSHSTNSRFHSAAVSLGIAYPLVSRPDGSQGNPAGAGNPAPAGLAPAVGVPLPSAFWNGGVGLILAAAAGAWIAA